MTLIIFDLSGEDLPQEVLFEVLRKYCLLQSVLCTAGASPESGLRAKQTYSILDVQKVGKPGQWLRAVLVRKEPDTEWCSRDASATRLKVYWL